ncbi:MAG: amino acid dehydrogenase [Cyclobacteriaceae bacterium]|nr:MAG: amino acid dehydrogenase [Cyclobacteriaceae bacterium]
MKFRQVDVAVVGGGIIGLFCAYYLSKAGRSVIVIEKGSLKETCSYGNCGLISPSHALPLNSPELLMKAVKWLFQKNSPFYIKPQLDFSFLKWMLGFALVAMNREQIERSMAGRNNLLQTSRLLYDDLFAHTSIDSDWATSGIHFIFNQPKAFEAYREKNRLLTEIGLAADPITGEELYKREPALTKQSYGSWFYPMDASLDPGKLLSGLKQQLVSMGVSLSEGSEVQYVSNHGNRVNEVITTSGKIRVKDVVLATGAWSGKLKNQIHLGIPIIPGKGYSITMKKPMLSPKCPCIFDEHKVVATPWKDRYRLGGTMEFSGYNNNLDEVRVANLKKVAAKYLKDPFSEEDTELWCGWRPMTTDGMPIIDRAPKLNNLFLACGHNMLGLSMAPATGKLIAELVTGQQTHIDIDPYSFNRF